MPKFQFLLILFLFSLSGISQGEELAPLNPNSGSVTIRGQSSPPPAPVMAPATNPAAINPAASAPPQDQHDEEAVINELQLGREKQMKKIQAIQSATKPLAEPFNPVAELQKLGHKQIDLTSLLDKKVLAILKKTLQEAHMEKLSVEEVKKLILDKVQGSHMEEIFKKFPKLLEISVNIIRDKDALIGLLGILRRKEDLKIYGYLCLGLFLFGMFVKFRIIKHKWPWFKKFRYSTSVNLVMTSVSFYLLYSFFGDELGPTFDVIVKSF